MFTATNNTWLPFFLVDTHHTLCKVGPNLNTLLMATALLLLMLWSAAILLVLIYLHRQLQYMIDEINKQSAAIVIPNVVASDRERPSTESILNLPHHYSGPVGLGHSDMSAPLTLRCMGAGLGLGRGSSSKSHIFSLYSEMLTRISVVSWRKPQSAGDLALALEGLAVSRLSSCADFDSPCIGGRYTRIGHLQTIMYENGRMGFSASLCG